MGDRRVARRASAPSGFGVSFTMAFENGVLGWSGVLGF